MKIQESQTTLKPIYATQARDYHAVVINGLKKNDICGGSRLEPLITYHLNFVVKLL